MGTVCTAGVGKVAVVRTVLVAGKQVVHKEEEQAVPASTLAELSMTGKAEAAKNL